MSITFRDDLVEELLDGGLHAEGHRRRGLLGLGEEVGDAGDHADVALGPDLRQALSEDLGTGTKKNLAFFKKRTTPTIGLVHVPLDVGIPEHTEDELKWSHRRN
jgi:hypothetical protein